jgi:hypothetical protein
LNTNAASDSGDDGYSQLTTDGEGHWIAVWDSYDDLNGTIGTDRDILIARSSDNGLTWTDPEPLNTTAANDSELDLYAQVTTDGEGHWIAAWESDNDLDGTIGTDWDILVAQWTLTPDGCPAAEITARGAQFETAGQGLGTVRVFRDRILNGSAIGRYLTEEYCRHGGEIVSIMRSDPDLFFRTVALFSEALPAIERACSDDGAVVLDRGLVVEIEELAAAYKMVASPALAGAIEQVRATVKRITREEDGTRLRIEFPEDHVLTTPPRPTPKNSCRPPAN